MKFRPVVVATLVALVATTMAACASKKQASAATDTAAPTTPAITLVSLERKPCFGTCPVYVVTIASDGAMVFEGRKYVDSMGTKNTKLDAARVKAIHALIADHQFFALDDKYAYGEANCRTYASDAPVVITTVTTKDKVKRVEHDGGCADTPPRLRDLEQRIDSLADVARFIRGKQ
jgi:hypothetical protein